MPLQRTDSFQIQRNCHEILYFLCPCSFINFLVVFVQLLTTQTNIENVFKCMDYLVHRPQCTVYTIHLINWLSNIEFIFCVYAYLSIFFINVFPTVSRWLTLAITKVKRSIGKCYSNFVFNMKFNNRNIRKIIIETIFDQSNRRIQSDRLCSVDDKNISLYS